MDFVTSGMNPWRQWIPMHASWDLLWLSVLAAGVFLAVHATYVRLWSKRPLDEPVVDAERFPERVPRHSFGARLFHWVMAAAMFALLFTSFLPIVGIQFAWVRWHWIAGLVLTASFVFHFVHATFFLDFRSIWPDRRDLEDAAARVARSVGRSTSTPRKAGKYPLENKLYHLTLVVTGLTAAITGVFMMLRVETPFWKRNPYVIDDFSWGVLYASHGLAGIALVGLVIVHVYFAVRPEKRPITNSMILGWMSRTYFLRHHDPERWKVTTGRKEAV